MCHSSLNSRGLCSLHFGCFVVFSTYTFTTDDQRRDPDLLSISTRQYQRAEYARPRIDTVASESILIEIIGNY